MTKNTNKYAQKLIESIITTKELTDVSEMLENLTQSKSFKDHANSILSDSDLSESQKNTQLHYLLRSIEDPILYTFFSDVLDKGHSWLISSGKKDYFSKFVEIFQLKTQKIQIVKIATAINLENNSLYHLSKSLSEFIGAHVVISHTVKPAILGGIEMAIENIAYDFTLRSKFTSFKHEWLKLLNKTEKSIGRNQIDSL